MHNQGSIKILSLLIAVRWQNISKTLYQELSAGHKVFNLCFLLFLRFAPVLNN